MSAKQTEKLIERLGVLVVDQSQYMRRLTRMMLMSIGVKLTYEAADGVAALDIVRQGNADVMILDVDVPVLDGLEVIRIVRSPGVFPRPDLPIIVLTACSDRSRVHETIRLGAHEFLVKPTSPNALRDRLLSIFCKPRQMTQIGKFYVPQSRTGCSERLAGIRMKLHRKPTPDWAHHKGAAREAATASVDGLFR